MRRLNEWAWPALCKTNAPVWSQLCRSDTKRLKTTFSLRACGRRTQLISASMKSKKWWKTKMRAWKSLMTSAAKWRSEWTKSKLKWVSPKRRCKQWWLRLTSISLSSLKSSQKNNKSNNEKVESSFESVSFWSCWQLLLFEWCFFLIVHINILSVKYYSD